MKAKNLSELKRLVQGLSKRCPFCTSTKLTTRGGIERVTMRHRCLDCECEFPEGDALLPEKEPVRTSASFIYTSPTIENIFSRHKRRSNGN